MGAGGGGGVLDRRDVLDLMHSRSPMTIDPLTPTMPGRREHVGFSPTRQALLAPSAKGGGGYLCDRGVQLLWCVWL